MITSISIADIASYGSEQQSLSTLSQFNYIYGSNGSGKTTISRVIADDTAHTSCSLSWSGGKSLDTFVYNRDFIEQVYDEQSDFPGIFTLGEESTQLLADIETAKQELTKMEDEAGTLKATLEGDDGKGGKRGELAVLKDRLRDACWAKKKKLGGAFREAFQGYLNNKEKFVKKVVAEKAANEAALKELSDLTLQAETVFGTAPTSVSRLAELTYNSLLEYEESSVLVKKVIGKDDVDIAAMIKRLENSDWVSEGQKFFRVNDDDCPFCQQKAPEGFAESLAEYFDETFATDTSTISTLVTDYKTETERIETEIETLLKNPPTQLDAKTLASKLQTVAARLKINRDKLATKKSEPSSAVTLDSSKDLLDEVADLVTTANKAISKHNVLVKNLASEKNKLTSQCWKYLLDVELCTELTTYDTDVRNVKTAIESLTNNLAEKQQAIGQKKRDLTALEKKTTSVQPTINEVNEVLLSFGFDGFSLAEADTPHCYKLIRPDGSDAKQTLSEGERSFITFLYFYNFLKGSQSDSGTVTDRVVVFDDPVSSLDSDVLFIVSTLIKRLKQDVLGKASPIKQIFVLTHNVYFHKEVTFDSRRHGIAMNEETFWTVRKSDGVSEVTEHDKNPITTGYDLLWSELRESPRSTVATQNAMRRILEHYFKILGGIDPTVICDQFTGSDQLICKSLMSWVNDGSHSASDDLYLAVGQEVISTYERVFKLIFDRTNQFGHYDMMMGTPPSVAIPITAATGDASEG